MEQQTDHKQKSSLRQRAERAKEVRSKTLICVLENPDLLQNVCSIIRNIDALGIAKLYVIDGGKLKLPNTSMVNPLGRTWSALRQNPHWLSGSVGAVKWVYIKRFNNTQECATYLAKKNFHNVGTSPHIKGRKNLDLSQAKFTQKQVAIWFGNESIGLSNEAINQCKECIQIPMCGLVESLNLGSCSGIVLYEAMRQRLSYKNKV